jgi:protease PrsW
VATPAPALEPLPRPRWGFQTSLFQWREPAFYVFLLLVLFGMLRTLAEQSILRQVSPGGWVLSWALLLPLYAVPVIIAVLRLDLYEREPLSLMLGALLWGGAVATSVAGLANTGWLEVVNRLAGGPFAAKWGAALVAPFDEEVMKLLGVVIIYQIARSEIDDLMDGFVYGALVGLGFAVVEDVFYFIAAFGGSPAGVLAAFWIRVVSSGLYGHILYTGLSGIGLAYFVTRRGVVPLSRRLGVMVGLLLVAMAAHFVWDSPLLSFWPSGAVTPLNVLLFPLAVAAKGLPFLVFLGVLVGVARRREERWFATIMAPEVPREGITPEELTILEHPRLRRRAAKAMRRRAGRAAAQLFKRLLKAEVELAMVRTRVARDDDPSLLRQREYCRALRERLLAIPSAAGALRELGRPAS